MEKEGKNKIEEVPKEVLAHTELYNNLYCEALKWLQNYSKEFSFVELHSLLFGALKRFFNNIAFVVRMQNNEGKIISYNEFIDFLGSLFKRMRPDRYSEFDRETYDLCVKLYEEDKKNYE